jgi:dTMP kinase
MPLGSLFFTFDGIDGAGKSTQVQLFCQWLGQLGHSVVACRDPGSTPVGEALRRIVLDSASPSMHRRTEMLVYMAARAQMVDEVIRPALAAERIVVSDRYLLANIVYQGYAGGLDVEQVKRVGEIATDGLAPTRTFLLDLDPEVAAKRFERVADRMERQGADYFRQVREGFLTEAACSDGQIVVIDADQSIDQVHAAIRAASLPLLDRPD